MTILIKVGRDVPFSRSSQQSSQQRSDKATKKLKKIYGDKERLLRYFPDLIKIKSVGFTFRSGAKEVFESPKLDKNTLQELLRGFIKLTEEQYGEYGVSILHEIEFREKYVNLGNSNIEMVEIRYFILEDKIPK